MAHFALVDENNIVLQVLVVENSDLGALEFPESEEVGRAFLSNFGLDGTWYQTSYNSSFRHSYAVINGSYSEELEAFLPPSPFPSWVLSLEDYRWKSPKPCPGEYSDWTWDEASQDWVPAIKINLE
jgi:hypothetical protein